MFGMRSLQQGHLIECVELNQKINKTKQNKKETQGCSP